MAKTEPMELTYNYIIPDGNQTNYIDLAESISAVCRKLNRQGRCYYISRVAVQSIATPAASGAVVGLYTIPDTWVTHNAWVKAFNLWKSMQNRVLKDNPSIKGKWRDFKVFMDPVHSAAGVAGNLLPISQATVVQDGEWNYSTLVLPQHDVDPATGVVLAADEFEVHMMGDDIGGPLPANLTSGAIIKMYADTRSRQNADPLVPSGMAESWGTQLTDSGSQDPELADLIDAENDFPPYDNDDYPGGDANFHDGVLQAACITSPAILSDKDLGFKVPLGLIKLISSTSGSGSGVGFMLRIHLVAGPTKGLFTTKVGQ